MIRTTEYMNHAAKLMVAKLENIQIEECKICKNGIDGIPNCKAGECDLPIELVDKDGRIGVIVSNLENNAWNFPIDDRTLDKYYFFGFDENYDNVWKIPGKEVVKRLGNNSGMNFSN